MAPLRRKAWWSLVIPGGRKIAGKWRYIPPKMASWLLIWMFNSGPWAPGDAAGIWALVRQRALQTSGTSYSLHPAAGIEPENSHQEVRPNYNLVDAPIQADPTIDISAIKCIINPGSYETKWVTGLEGWFWKAMWTEFKVAPNIGKHLIATLALTTCYLGPKLHSVPSAK